ncbi:UDP-N-acetylmuramate dehydrogenase [Leeuwenhoekiella sp. LLG6367-2.1]|uniref:UDP-N-acetylmuramate dehydrogenase n=1 Tax=Leeuwenhoekiella sp. LLG6367-2.1 TaxID=3160833 RepID=UPI00386C0ADD
MNIAHDVSLKKYNTFGIDAKASSFVSVSTLDELKEALSTTTKRKFVLGGGSNMLIKNDIEALVIHINLKGIEVVKEDNNSIWLEVAAGENWHSFVMHCVNNNYGGVENLALIPGNTGTSPVQNIGAYGVELKDVFDSCSAINRNSLESKIFTHSDCKFGYRESIFKNDAKDLYVITSVTFKLSKKDHNLNTGYGAIQEVLKQKEIKNPTIKEIAEAVIHIRSSKLPDPKLLGNSGSFFKNPVIRKELYDSLQSKYAGMPVYPISNEEVKVPAGWLIEQAGFKGYRIEDAGVHDKQALVLVNYGNATGDNLWDLALQIKDEVYKKFKINIEPEVNIVK